MLLFKLSDNILEVVEVLDGCFRTTRNWWYYDINTWCKSSTGKENSPIDREMVENDIAWVKKYYLPLVQ